MRTSVFFSLISMILIVSVKSQTTSPATTMPPPAATNIPTTVLNTTIAAGNVRLALSISGADVRGDIDDPTVLSDFQAVLNQFTGSVDRVKFLALVTSPFIAGDFDLVVDLLNTYTKNDTNTKPAFTLYQSLTINLYGLNIALQGYDETGDFNIDAITQINNTAVFNSATLAPTTPQPTFQPTTAFPFTLAPTSPLTTKIPTTNSATTKPATTATVASSSTTTSPVSTSATTSTSPQTTASSTASSSTGISVAPTKAGSASFNHVSMISLVMMVILSIFLL